MSTMVFLRCRNDHGDDAALESAVSKLPGLIRILPSHLWAYDRQYCMAASIDGSDEYVKSIMQKMRSIPECGGMAKYRVTVAQ